jgi:hypothetical protein
MVMVQRVLACTSPHRLQSTPKAVENDLNAVVVGSVMAMMLRDLYRRANARVRGGDTTIVMTIGL